jgi:hypothetical protein
MVRSEGLACAATAPENKIMNKNEACRFLNAADFLTAVLLVILSTLIGNILL